MLALRSTLAMVVFIIIIVRTLVLCSGAGLLSLFLGVEDFTLVFVNFSFIIEVAGGLGDSRQQVAEVGLSLGIMELAIGRHFDLALDVQITRHRRVVGKRHTFLLDHQEVIRLDNVVGGGFDLQDAAVEVFEHQLKASEGLGKGDLLFDHEIVPVLGTLEVSGLERQVLPGGSSLVGLLAGVLGCLGSENDDDVSGLVIGLLRGLAVEDLLVARLHTTVDVDRDHLGVRYNLISITGITTIARSDDLTLSFTVGTVGSHLLDHSRTDLTNDIPHALTSAWTTGLHASSVLASLTHTVHTDDLSGHLEGLGLTIIKFGQSDSEIEANVFGLLRSSASTTATTEHAKQIVESTATATTSALFESLLAVLVIQLTLLWVGQSLMCTRDFFEPLFGFLSVVGVLIGVVFHGSLAESLLDLSGSCIRSNAQDIV